MQYGDPILPPPPAQNIPWLFPDPPKMKEMPGPKHINPGGGVVGKDYGTVSGGLGGGRASGPHDGTRGYGPGGKMEEPPGTFVDPGQGGGGGGGFFGNGQLLPPSDNGGGGGGGGPAPLTWADTYKVAGAPSWWKGLTPSQLDPQSEYAAMINALIPFLSPEDQRTAASNLQGLYGAEPLFAGYSLETTPAAPLPPNGPIQRTQYDYLSAARGANTLASLDAMRASMGKAATDFGPGYQYLRNLAAVMQNYGGTPGLEQQRSQYLAEQAALDPLLGESKGTSGPLAAYGPIAQYYTSPFAARGGPRDASRQQNGSWQFGTPNSNLY